MFFNEEHDRNAFSPIELTVPLISDEIKWDHSWKVCNGISWTSAITTCFVTLLYASADVSSLEFETVSVSVASLNTWKACVKNKTTKNK